MAPNLTSSPTDVLCTPEATLHSSSKISAGVEKPTLKYRREIVWPNVVMHIYLNLAALYGAYLMLTSAKVLTGLWGMCKRLYVCNDVYTLCFCTCVCIYVCMYVCMYVCRCRYVHVNV